MNIQRNIALFEANLANVKRPGMDKLLEYIRKSDFYRAPASTKYHLACEGGLLQHSLNVLSALRWSLRPDDDLDASTWHYSVAASDVETIPDETAIVVALLHDICKANFYGVSYRNVKNEATGKWEKAPYYTVEDKMPLGHGAKSAMILKEYIPLTTPEMYAVWWHMGYAGLNHVDAITLTDAIKKYPLIWALHTADMAASSFMEGEKDNLPPYQMPEAAPATEESGAAEWADAPSLAPA